MNGKQRHLHSYEEMRTIYDTRRTGFANETDAGRKNTTQSAAAKRADNRATRNQEAVINRMTKHSEGDHITDVADDAAHASMKLRAPGIADVRQWVTKGKHGATQSKTKGLRHHERSRKSGKTTFSRSYHLLARI